MTRRRGKGVGRKTNIGRPIPSLGETPSQERGRISILNFLAEPRGAGNRKFDDAHFFFAGLKGPERMVGSAQRGETHKHDRLDFVVW